MAIVGSSIWICGRGFGCLGAGDRFADRDAFDAGDGEYVAGLADGFVYALQAFERIQLGDPRFVKRAVQLDDGDFIAVPQRAVEDATDGQAAEIVAVIEIGDQKLKRSGGSPFGAGM